MRARPDAAAPKFLTFALPFTLALGMAACGGGGSGPAPAVITAQPADQSVVAGSTAAFHVAATGATGYQWQRSTDGGASYTDMAGSTSATLALTAVPLADDGHRFRAVVSNGGGSVTSNAALLTVTALPAVVITTSSPLPSGMVNTPYSVQLAASGGTPPFTWSVSSGMLPAGLGLDGSTGLISGTPTAAATYGPTIQVSDSANPQQSDTRTFDINVDAQCDVGFGSVTVAGAPNTVEGRFCAQTATPPGTPNGYGIVFATWREIYPYGGGAYSEGLTVTFYPATGLVDSVLFHLSDPTRSILWYCAAGAAGPPPCTGVTVDVVLGKVTFLDTVLGENGTVNNPLTLNGMLTY